MAFLHGEITLEGEDKVKHYHFSKSDTSIAKLIAISLMLLHHLFGFTDRILPENMYQSLYMFRGRPIEAKQSVLLLRCVLRSFLFLSGYGTYLSMRKSKSISKMIANRIFRFLKYIWQVMIIFVPIDFILGVTKVNLTSSWTIQYDFESIILSMLGFEKYNGEWWFVMPYIFLLMMTPLMFRFLKRKKLISLQIFSLFWGLLCFLLYGIPRLMSYDMLIDFKGTVWGILLCNVVYLLPIYLFGMIFCKVSGILVLSSDITERNIKLPCIIICCGCKFFMRYKIGSSYDFPGWTYDLCVCYAY